MSGPSQFEVGNVGPGATVLQGEGLSPIFGDKSPEQLVRILESQLKQKDGQIERLTDENKALTEINAVFRMVTLTIGEHFLSVNDYIMHTCNFLSERSLRQDFRDYLPTEVCGAGRQDG